jgi:hypothetical protein
MKKLLIPLLLFIGVHEVSAQADPSAGGTKTPFIMNISDFGALPNDGIDDSRAFALAARFFSNRDIDHLDDGDDDNYHPGSLLPPSVLNIDYTTQYGVLKLDAGIYDVGEQIVDPSSNGGYFVYPKYFSVYDNNIDGLIIEGAGMDATIIRHSPGYFGWFDPSNFHPMYEAAGGKGTKMGAIFRNNANTKNIIIQDLKLDGSSDHYIVGSRQATNPGDFNTVDYGLLLGGQFITLQNVDIVNFGCDGINFAVSYDTPPIGRYNILMDNVLSRWNGRQALTWSAGRSAKIINSTFAYTGLRYGQFDTDPTTTSPSDVNGSIGTNVDFESEIGPIRDGIFGNCKILGNFGTAASVVIHTDVDNVSFENCVIKGFENSDPSKGRSFFSISMGGDLAHSNFVFDGCTIRG